MKVFKFYVGHLYYGYAAQTEEEAISSFKEDTGEDFDKKEEIPESEWDKKDINIWEDNDTNKKPFKVSIRESISGEEAHQIFTNDIDFQ